jgi:hypothetical protein
VYLWTCIFYTTQVTRVYLYLLTDVLTCFDLLSYNMRATLAQRFTVWEQAIEACALVGDLIARGLKLSSA